MSTEIINTTPITSASSTPHPGHFKPGQSGNPAGRPRGARNKATLATLALLDEAAPRLVREAIDRALDGDSLLLRCCVTRMVPVPRGRPVELDLAEGSAAGDVVASLAATVRAMAEGAISPLEAADVAEVLEGQRRAQAMARMWASGARRRMPRATRRSASPPHCRRPTQAARPGAVRMG